MTIEEVLRKHEDELMQRPGVQGVAIGVQGGRKVVKILIGHRIAGTSHTSAQYPAELEGYPVVVEEIGTIMPQ